MGTVLLCFALALSGPPSYFAPRVHCGMDCSRPSAPSLLAYLLTLLSLPYSSILFSHTILSYTTPHPPIQTAHRSPQAGKTSRPASLRPTAPRTRPRLLATKRPLRPAPA